MTQHLVKIASLALALFTSFAQANIVMVTEVTHNYGSTAGRTRIYTSSTCVGSGSVSVREDSSCGSSFYDSFAFSGIAADAQVTLLVLTLNFGNTGDRFSSLIRTYEDWYVRPATSKTTLSSDYKTLYSQLKNSTETTTDSAAYTWDNLALFDTIVANRVFGFTFAEETSGSHRFDLQSATFRVYADVPVVQPAAPASRPNDLPEPSMLTLLGGALLALRLTRRSLR